MEQQASVMAATLRGIEAVPVRVEVSVGPGLPGVVIVGMPDASVQEARQRVRSALKASGYAMPTVRIVVNLAPSDLRKSGSGFDLPIAVGILRATGQIDPRIVEDALFFGELSLDGGVRQVRGLLSYAQAASSLDLALVCAPIEGELQVISGVEYRCLPRLADLRNKGFRAPQWLTAGDVPPGSDFSEVAGHDLAKRGLQIAAAGGHGVLMMGPPGSGKTMLAHRLSTIMPPMSEEELVESASIYSLVGKSPALLLNGQRPFRAPHHSATRAGLLGGGHPLLPGEVSLAHNGVLFLDEMPEFGSGILQLLRQPIEDGFVALSRADGVTVFPSRFALVGAANPCPCGYYGDPEHSCSCTPGQVATYQARIGGPLLDRFDINLDIWRTSASSVLATGSGVDSTTLRIGVLAARAFAQERLAGEVFEESAGEDERLLLSCHLNAQAKACIESLATLHHLSGRGIMRVIRVARTIADLAASVHVQEEHLIEAVSFRVRTGE